MQVIYTNSLLFLLDGAHIAHSIAIGIDSIFAPAAPMLRTYPSTRARSAWYFCDKSLCHRYV